MMSDVWESYELIDSGNFKRLERFGDYYLVRPEPNALWKPENINHRGWSKPDAEFSGDWKIFTDDLQKGWNITWKNVVMHLKLTSFRHVGVFPEQQVQWNQVREWAEKSENLKMLNLFAYTGVLSTAAAQAGAQVTHVDASKSSVSWAKENAELSGVSSIRWIVEDVRKFVDREVRRGSIYDIIVLDPPVFGRGTKGEIWRLEEEFCQLIEMLQRVSHGTTKVLINIYATATYPESFKRVVEQIYGKEVAVKSTKLIQSEGKKDLQTGYSLTIEN